MNRVAFEFQSTLVTHRLWG